jgi:hypothetical protein
MAKKFRPTLQAKQQLDSIVESGKTETPKMDIQADQPTIQRKPNGYTLRADYVKNVSILAAALGMKKYEVIESALEMFFEKHKDIL